MKGLFILLILAGIVYGGMIFYRSGKIGIASTAIPKSSGSSLILTQSSDKLGSIAAVLGAKIGTAVENGQSMLSDVTNGASEPIINQLVSKTQETLKDLPKKEAEKIKYEFCKGVVTEFENKSTNNQ